MKERGIPMAGMNIAPIQADIKTHTRRIMKFQPPDQLQESPYIYTASLTRSGSKPVTVASWGDGACICPYGNAGDRLWVREAWRTESDYYNDLSPSEMSGEETILYEADGKWSDNKTVGRYRHARFMPRWASRILLEIKDIRVERLLDISEADAKAEGVRLLRDGGGTFVGREGPEKLVTPWMTAVDAYRELWESINGAGSWDANPYVWVIIFRRIEQ